MKICFNCKKEKDESHFYKKGSKGKLHSYCKDCFNNFQMRRWEERKKKFVHEMGGECKKCGYKKNYAALSFHHIDASTKEFDWNKLRLISEKRIRKELTNCILICHNCHAELHCPQLTMP